MPAPLESVGLEGVAGYEADLQRLQTVESLQFKAAIAAAAQAALATTRRRAPVLTGALRRDVTMVKRNRAYVVRAPPLAGKTLRQEKRH